MSVSLSRLNCFSGFNVWHGLTSTLFLEKEYRLLFSTTTDIQNGGVAEKLVDGDRGRHQNADSNKVIPRPLVKWYWNNTVLPTRTSKGPLGRKRREGRLEKRQYNCCSRVAGVLGRRCLITIRWPLNLNTMHTVEFDAKQYLSLWLWMPTAETHYLAIYRICIELRSNY